MTIRLNGSTSGYAQLDSAAVGGNNTLVLPTTNGTANQALVTDGSGTLSFADRGRMVLATAQNSTSGTSIDFTGIPSWVKRVTVMFNGVSTSGTSPNLLRLGTSSGFVSTGYASGGVYTGPSTGSGTRTDGLMLDGNGVGAADFRHGHAILTNVSSNIWTQSFVMGQSNNGYAIFGGGSISLSGTLTQLRITTVNGTDTFDAGNINLLLEG